MAFGVDDIVLLGGASALLGAGIGMGNMFTSAHTAYDYNKALQDRAFAHQIKMFKNQNQWRVQDLRNAGLNPILATHSASSMPSAASASVGTTPVQSVDLMSSIAKAQGFSSARDLQEYARDNHRVDLATKEADLAGRELSHELIRSEIHQRNAQTAMTLLDHERRSRPWYRNFEDMRDLRSAFGKQSFWGKTMDDIFVNPWLESLHSADKLFTDKKPAIEIRKRPSISTFTNYKYRYYRKK